jgi:hypothetical protein
VALGEEEEGVLIWEEMCKKLRGEDEIPPRWRERSRLESYWLGWDLV